MNYLQGGRAGLLEQGKYPDDRGLLQLLHQQRHFSVAFAPVIVLSHGAQPFAHLDNSIEVELADEMIVTLYLVFFIAHTQFIRHYKRKVMFKGDLISKERSLLLFF